MFKWNKLSERQKFEVKLALAVFFLTIVSSVISSSLVYYFTLDKSPDIVVSVTGVEEGVIEFLVSNFAENPANNVIVREYVEGIDQQPSSLGTPLYTLYKGSENMSLDLVYFDRQIASNAEEFLKTKQIDYNSGKFLLINTKDNEGRKFGRGMVHYNVTDFQTLYKIEISATCKNCGNGDIVINSPIIYYWPIIECERVISVRCSVENGELSWPTK